MAPLPWAALGAVVFYAAGKLVSIPEFRRLWRFRRREFMLGVITLVGTVFIGILQGVVLAIALSLLEMLYRLARPHEGVLGRVPGVDGMHDVADYPDARTIPGCMFYRYDAPLFFANIDDLRERVGKLIAIENEAYPDSPLRWFVLNVEANVEIDIPQPMACESWPVSSPIAASTWAWLGLRTTCTSRWSEPGSSTSLAKRCSLPRCRSPRRATCAGPWLTSRRNPRKRPCRRSRTNPPAARCPGTGPSRTMSRSKGATRPRPLTTVLVDV